MAPRGAEIDSILFLALFLIQKRIPVFFFCFQTFFRIASKLSACALNQNFSTPGKEYDIFIFRKKLSDLEQRLHAQHLEDRLGALQELELRKSRELEASKSGWEEQIKQLSSQVGKNSWLPIQRNYIVVW